jgi:tetratricopeptide (TPR) repeat protein
MSRLWLLGLILTIALVVGVGARPWALSCYYLEAGSQALQVALAPVFTDRLAPEQVVNAEQLAAGADYMRKALQWDPHNVQARRQLARVYVSQDQPEMALEELSAALAVRPANPLLQLELGDVYDSLGQTEEAIKAYRAGRVGSRRASLAVNYIKLADAQVEAGGGDVAIDLWRQMLKADPGNLYALYQLARIHRELGDKKTAKAYEEQSRNLDLRSVSIPLDGRMAEYQAQAMIGLVDAGVWRRDTLLNAVSYQVWQYADGMAGLMTECVLRALLERWPDDADILFYQADLERHRGDLALDGIGADNLCK